MPIHVEWRSSGALVNRLEAIRQASDMSGKGSNRVKGDLRTIIVQDNTEKLLGRGLLEGVDRYGKPLTPMAPATYRNKKRGFGPVLVPRGLASRFITNFEAVWIAGELVCRYVNIVNKRGKSFAQYHLTGVPRGAKKSQPNWSLPKRDVGGITPQGWAKINARFKKYVQDVAKGQG